MRFMATKISVDQMCFVSERKKKVLPNSILGHNYVLLNTEETMQSLVKLKFDFGNKNLLGFAE